MLNATPQSQRPAQRRPGSVLVIVVAVLTLLALIGTAYIATVRHDRIATREHTRLTDNKIDREQKLHTIQQMVEYAVIRGGILGDVTSPAATDWLGDRLPRAIPTAPTNPMWRFISGKIDPTIPNAMYQSPLVVPSIGAIGYAGYLTAPQRSATAAYPMFVQIDYPANASVPEQFWNTSRRFPAIHLIDVATGAPVLPAPAQLAADADGDGIADSLLWRISDPQDGVTYFAAVRIVDNAAAINVNTAWTRDFSQTGYPLDAAGTPQLNNGLFLSSIGLRELFVESPAAKQKVIDQMREINEYRFGFGIGLQSFSKNGQAENLVLPSLTAMSDTPALRPDLAFNTPGEAFSTQAGRRLFNPGYNLYGATPFNYRPFLETDAAFLAYRFCLVRFDESAGLDATGSINVGNGFLAAVGDLERQVQLSVNPQKQEFDALVRSAPNYAGEKTLPLNFFPADASVLWFQTLNYEAGTSYLYTPQVGVPNQVPGTRFRSPRPLLTTTNAVSNFAPPKFNDRIDWNNDQVPDRYSLYPGMTYNRLFNGFMAGIQPNYRGPWSASAVYNVDEVVFDAVPGSSTLGGFYVCRQANAGQPLTLAGGVANSTYWVYQPAYRRGAWNSALQYAPGDIAIDAGYSYVCTQTSTNNPPNSSPTFWDYQPPVSGRTKTSINTAGFPELWNSFYKTMAGDRRWLAANPYDANALKWATDATISPFDLDYLIMVALIPPAYIRADVGTQMQTNNYDPYLGMKSGSPAENSLRMFRSSIRDPRGSNQERLTPAQMMTIRSALAAVNTLDLLDEEATDTITSRRITLFNYSVDPNLPILHPAPAYEVTVYGLEKQPFITEVYANNDKQTYTHPTLGDKDNNEGYVIIELYNPHSVDIRLNNWKLAYRSRKSTDPFGSATDVLTEITANFANTIVPAGGRLLIENYGTTGAKYRPPSVVRTSGTTSIPFTGNIVERLTGSDQLRVLQVPDLGKALDKELILLRPVNPAVASNVEDMVPVDQFDFTGMKPSAASGRASWHYFRPDTDWKMVYPGKYDGSVASGTPRHLGVKTSSYNPDHDDWNPTDAMTDYGIPNGNGTASDVKMSFGDDNSTTVADFYYSDPFVIPLNVDATPGPNPLSGPPPYRYPYGGFARNGDILNVPFIGAYKIRSLAAGSAPVLEMNSVTMDAAFAEDTNPNNDAVEQIGRFCPISYFDSNTGNIVFPEPDCMTYDWAGALFDYFDVQLPSDDYLPNVSPRRYPTAQPIPSNGQAVVYANQLNDDATPTHGKININTASAKVLSMLPLVRNPDGTVNVTATESMARAIVTWRDTKGPFRSITDLNMVPGFQAAVVDAANNPTNGPTILVTGNPGANDGDLMPDNVNNDFESRYLAISRISNLITTRSDSFTCYIVVQGWRNAGTAYPSLDWEQRKAFILDRSAIYNGVGPLKRIPVPTD